MIVQTLKNESGDKTLKFAYKCLYVLLSAYLLLYPFRISGINALLGKTLVLFNWLTVVYVILMSKNYNKVFISFALAFGIILAIVVSTDEIEEHYLQRNLGAFLGMIFLIETQRNIKVDRSLVKFISYFNVVFCLLFFAYSYMPFAYIWEDEGSFVELTSLTLGYSNPNAVAMMLLYCSAINLIASKCKIYPKLISYALHAVFLYLIYRTNSRSSLLVAGLLTVMSFVPLKNIPKIFLIGAISVPVAYISLLPYLKSIGFMSSVEVLGKSIYTGREEIYIDAMRYLKSPLNWMFGDFSKGGFTNFHNSMLSLLITIGIFGLALYILIWYRNIVPYMKNTNKVSAVAIYALMAILIQSSSEAAFLIGTIPYNIMVVTLFIFVRYKQAVVDENSPS